MLSILLDTNILIDFYQRREPHVDYARQLMLASSFGDAELWVSAKSFADVFYVLSKRHPSSEVQAAFLESLGWLKVCSIDGPDVKLASERTWDDFEDCLVAIAAEKAGADFLITRDAAGFADSRVPALSPQAFFDHLAAEHGIVYETVDWDEDGRGDGREPR